MKDRQGLHRVQQALAKIFSQGGPFFLYQETLIEESVRSVRDFWRQHSLAGFELFYSVKSNPNGELLKVLAQVVDGFDVSSLAEAELVRRSIGVEAKMTWSGPAKTDRAIAQMVTLNPMMIHLDSIEEWQKLKDKNLPLSLRFSLSQSQGQKLGFSKIDLKRLLKERPDSFLGLHAYLGRESFSSELLIQVLREIDILINENRPYFDSAEIFLGPGLPMPLVMGSHPEVFSNSVAPKRKINLECGRSLIQNSGTYGTQILAVKKASGVWNAIIDGGLQHMATHLNSPRFKNEGVEVQFYRDGKRLEGKSQKVTLHGSLSLWHDVMIENIDGPADLRRGDWMLARPVGAYGLSAASNQFLGPALPNEFLISKRGELRNFSAPGYRPYHLAWNTL